MKWQEDNSLERPDGVSPLAVVRLVRVPPELAGRRLDVFLTETLRNTSRTRSQAIIENSAFSVSGKPLRSSDRVRAEDRVALWRLPVDQLDEDIVLPILYEDEHLLVIDKPAPLTVHPSARHYQATVTKVLEGLRPNERITLIHRLDKETSGVLLIARTKEADRAFKLLLEHRSLAVMGVGKPRAVSPMAKTYLAITWGVPPDGLVELALEADPHPLRVKMRVTHKTGGMDSATRFRVIEDLGDYALVECQLLTGRQHQIRVHLAALGCPVVGDKLYGPDDSCHARGSDGTLTADDLRKLELPRQALHAHRYQLRHAITGEELDLKAPLPDELSEFLDSVRQSR